MKRFTVWIVLLVILIAVGAFLWLDIRVVQGETAVESQVETYAFSASSEEMPLLLEQDLALYVIAPERLQDDLTAALVEQLGTSPYVRDVNRRQPPAAAAPDSVLVVEIDEANVLWTPFYARSRLPVTVAYASDGEVAWIDEEVVRLNNDEPVEGLVVRLSGEFQVTDTAYGVMSLPGYYHYLGRQLAIRINESVAESLANQGS